MADDGDRAVLSDAHIDVRRPRRGGRALVPVCRVEADDPARADGNHQAAHAEQLQERAAIATRGPHVLLSAAALMAVLMRV